LSLKTNGVPMHNGSASTGSPCFNESGISGCKDSLAVRPCTHWVWLTPLMGDVQVWPVP
jgi:hypothetical protein